ANQGLFSSDFSKAFLDPETVPHVPGVLPFYFVLRPGGAMPPALEANGPRPPAPSWAGPFVPCAVALCHARLPGHPSSPASRWPTASPCFAPGLCGNGRYSTNNSKSRSNSSGASSLAAAAQEGGYGQLGDSGNRPSGDGHVGCGGIGGARRRPSL
ncbi:hypothetical protein Vretimale_8010, partial [Volvox reticuliferus]